MFQIKLDRGVSYLSLETSPPLDLPTFGDPTLSSDLKPSVASEDSEPLSSLSLENLSYKRENKISNTYILSNQKFLHILYMYNMYMYICIYPDNKLVGFIKYHKFKIFLKVFFNKKKYVSCEIIYYNLRVGKYHQDFEKALFIYLKTVLFADQYDVVVFLNSEVKL